MKLETKTSSSKFMTKTSYSVKSSSLFKGVKNNNFEPHLTNFDTVTQHTKETLASIDE